MTIHRSRDCTQAQRLHHKPYYAPTLAVLANLDLSFKKSNWPIPKPKTILPTKGYTHIPYYTPTKDYIHKQGLHSQLRPIHPTKDCTPNQRLTFQPLLYPLPQWLYTDRETVHMTKDYITSLTMPKPLLGFQSLTWALRNQTDRYPSQWLYSQPRAILTTTSRNHWAGWLAGWPVSYTHLRAHET